MDILNEIEQKKYLKIKKHFDKQNPVDIADELEKIKNIKYLIKCFRLLKKDTASTVFSYLSSKTQHKLIEEITTKELGVIIQDLFVDDTIDIIENMPPNIVKKILYCANSDKRKQINKFLCYKEKTAGAIMTAEFIELKENTKIYKAIKQLKRRAKNKQTINYIYVTDDLGKLKGVLSLKELIISKDNNQLNDIMTKKIICVNTEHSQSYVSSIFKKYDFSALPVLDNDNRMIGIITVDDILDVIEVENTEDIQKMAGITPNKKTYLETSVFKHSKQRIFWVLVLMISSIFTGLLLSQFENSLAKEIVLVSFLPMLMSTTGNCGSQTSTLIIRGLTLNEIVFKDYFKIMIKELKISLILGFTVSIFNFIRVILQYKRLNLALVISITMLIVIIIANFIGFTMPILAKKLKFDPAVMSSPIITTLLDCFVVLIYFSIAKLFLGL